MTVMRGLDNPNILKRELGKVIMRFFFGQAMKEMNFKLIANFFLTTFPTNMHLDATKMG